MHPPRCHRPGSARCLNIARGWLAVHDALALLAGEVLLGTLPLRLLVAFRFGLLLGLGAGAQGAAHREGGCCADTAAQERAAPDRVPIAWSKASNREASMLDPLSRSHHAGGTRFRPDDRSDIVSPAYCETAHFGPWPGRALDRRKAIPGTVAIHAHPFSHTRNRSSPVRKSSHAPTPVGRCRLRVARSASPMCRVTGPRDIDAKAEGGTALFEGTADGARAGAQAASIRPSVSSGSEAPPNGIP